MKLTTIWTLPAASVGEKILRTREWIFQALASRLPVRLKYWVTIQSLALATRDSHNVPAAPVGDVLRKIPSPSRIY